MRLAEGGGTKEINQRCGGILREFFLIKWGFFLTYFFFIAVSFSDYIIYSGIGLWGVFNYLGFCYEMYSGTFKRE